MGDQLDSIDDKIFNIACELNELLGLNYDMQKMDHTALVIEIRDSILNELSRQGKDGI